MRRYVRYGRLVPRHARSRVGRRIGQSLTHGERAMNQSTTIYGRLPRKVIFLTSAGVECTNLSGLLRDCSRPGP
jgi:alkyl sulfatase BDS1-like metallo-beta-lactamase superfamily hydrolase